MSTFSSKITLNNGIEMPILGLGVFDSGESTAPAVQCAIQNGYRLIDTAAFYGNEREVGEGVKRGDFCHHKGVERYAEGRPPERIF